MRDLHFLLCELWRRIGCLLLDVCADSLQMEVTKCSEAPYGAWASPLTAEFVSGSSKRLGGAAVDSEGRLLWLEGRPSEAG